MTSETSKRHRNADLSHWGLSVNGAMSQMGLFQLPKGSPMLTSHLTLLPQAPAPLILPFLREKE